jgi:hypothetical protein
MLTVCTLAGAQEGPPTSDWQFRWNGYFRAPLRIGVGRRDPCPAGQAPTSSVPMGLAPSKYNGGYCAAPGQSRTTFHSPYVPDDQYYAWSYDRQWEQAWAEVYLSYGNDKVAGTIGLQAYDFSDVGLLGNQANPAQFGIGQAWLTVTPDLPVDGLRTSWKVGAFIERFGMAGKYDAGPYDTTLFGRTHTIGETLALQYDLGDFTLKLAHGFGVHLEMVPAGFAISGSQVSLTYATAAPRVGTMPPAHTFPPAASPGFTLLDHFHAGVSYKKRLEVNGHYLVAWSQDDREQGTQASAPMGGATEPSAASTRPDGSLTVAGVEARLLGGVLGDLYAAYSHIEARNVTTVGPAIEVIHSAGGGGHNAVANGIYENFFNGVGTGDGRIDSFEAAYDFSFGALWRKLARPEAPNLAGDGADVKLSLFLLYSGVSGTDPTSMNLLTGAPTAGTQKLKYGADLVADVFPWLALGVRGDYVRPDSHDGHASFGVVSPKAIVRTRLLTHEEITIQYSHYWDGSDVLPQQWLAIVGVRNIALSSRNSVGPNSVGPAYPNDANVFGIKASLWW